VRRKMESQLFTCLVSGEGFILLGYGLWNMGGWGEDVGTNCVVEVVV